MGVTTYSLLVTVLLLSVIPCHEARECYLKFPSRSVPSREFKISQANSQPCIVDSSSGISFKPSDYLSGIKGCYIKKSCRCLKEHLKEIRDCNIKSYSCEEICTSAKVCYNGGTLKDGICNDGTVTEESISCKCKDPFKGDTCENIKEIRSCSLKKDVGNVPQCDNKGRSFCSATVRNVSFVCGGPIDDQSLIDENVPFCEDLADEKSTSSERQSYNTSQGLQRTCSGQDENSTRNSIPIVPIIITVVITIVLTVPMTLYVWHLCGKKLSSRRYNKTESEDKSRMMTSGSCINGHNTTSDSNDPLTKENTECSIADGQLTG